MKKNTLHFSIIKRAVIGLLIPVIIYSCRAREQSELQENTAIEDTFPRKEEVVKVDENPEFPEDRLAALEKSHANEIAALDEAIELSESENDSLLGQVKLYYKKIHLLETDKDSLQSVINGLHIVNEALKQPDKRAVWSTDQNEIQKMVFDMHRAWKDLPKNKDPEQILSFFHPNFVVNRIAIEANNTAQIARFSHEDFEDYLKDIMREKGLFVQFGAVKFLNIEVKDQAYFNVDYKCLMRSYEGDKLQDTSSLSVTITGKKTNGKWKIASYSWVSFKYD